MCATRKQGSNIDEEMVNYILQRNSEDLCFMFFFSFLFLEELV